MTHMPVVLLGTGLYTPKDSISNDELVATFNQYVTQFNQEHAAEIAAGSVEALAESSSAFIEKASGIKSRFVVDKAGILNPNIMKPQFAPRDNEALSVQAEIGVAAAKQALEHAGVNAADIDMVIVATFGVQMAANAIAAGSAKRVLIVNAEICTAHLNFRERDSHFIFGDAATALVLVHQDLVNPADAHKGFNIVDTSLWTQFSNNIRNNAGFLNRAEVGNDPLAADKLFVQNGRKVFKEVCPAVGEHIVNHLQKNQIEPTQVKRFWLHQANLTMNELISKRVLGRPATPEESPTILDTYANTSSAGSVIAMHLHHADMQPGDLGVLSSFGAGYSIGSVIVEKR